MPLPWALTGFSSANFWCTVRIVDMKSAHAFDKSFARNAASSGERNENPAQSP